MILYLYGPDSYRRNRYVRTHLLEPYQKKYPDGSIGHCDLESDGALARLKDFSGGAGLFAKVSLAVIAHPEEGEKDFIKFLKEIADSPATTVIVSADKKLTKDFAFLGAGSAEFEALSGMEFLKFIKAEAIARELKVSDTQLTAIGQMYDGDTWAAMTEIERVSSGGLVEQHGVEIDAFGLIRTLAQPLPRLVSAPRQQPGLPDARNDDASSTLATAGNRDVATGKPGAVPSGSDSSAHMPRYASESKQASASSASLASGADESRTRAENEARERFSKVFAQQLKAVTLLIDYDEPAKAFNLLTAFVFGSTKIKMADYDLAVKSGKLEYPEVLFDYVLG